jgi:integrase
MSRYKMLISDYAKRYATKVGGSPGYLEQLFVLTKRFPWHIEEVTQEMVDDYLTEALQRLAPATVANHRRMLRTLLLDAQRNNVNTCILQKFRRVKCPPPIPVAWSLAEIRQLVEAARKTPGQFRDLKKSSFLEAWYLTAYATGLRAGDLTEIRWDQIRGGRMYFLQSKTSRPHVAVFTDEALAACKALPKRVRVFGDFAALNTIQQWVAKCVKEAGLTGSTKWLRRSCATYAKVHGMSPKTRLGHQTDGLAERHYVDQLLYEEEAGIAGKPLPSVLQHTQDC